MTTASEAAKSCTEWHACATGDCEHEKYSECFDAVFVEGATWALTNDERVRGLVEALEGISNAAVCVAITPPSGHADILAHCMKRADDAIKEWEANASIR
ncbi:MAG TPA: hypothetical protein VEF04_09500 [Blastocatellia bacterium]|nr:hypothetical protein [Blastocatellia bacterium]